MKTAELAAEMPEVPAMEAAVGPRALLKFPITSVSIIISNNGDFSLKGQTKYRTAALRSRGKLVSRGRRAAVSHTYRRADREHLVKIRNPGKKRGRSINMAKSEAQFVVTCNLVRLAGWRSVMNVTN